MTIGDVLNDKINRRAPVLAPRPLYVIAGEIARDWKKVSIGAGPYLRAMGVLDSIDGMYGADEASSIVLYFLSNAKTWRGEVAKRIKAELNVKAEPGAKKPRKPRATKPKMPNTKMVA